MKIVDAFRGARISMLAEESTALVESKFPSTAFFWLTIVLYAAYLLAMEPRWVLQGEMWAEMATNYFANADSPSYFKRFFSVDAGYIPLPQRLIAYFVNLLSIPVWAVPYVYTWVSIAATGALVGAFCLPVFRRVVESDLLRFAGCLAVLMVPEFETRTFINFTYFVVFFAAIITSLAMTAPTREVPRWTWCLPILMLSKPYTFTILPAMLVVALSSKNRFRVISLVILCLSLIQFTQLVFSVQTGVMTSEIKDFSFSTKFLASIEYFFGFLSGYLLGPNVFAWLQSFGPKPAIAIGIVFFTAAVASLFLIKRRENALIIVGLSLLLFNLLLNCFTLSAGWNINLDRLFNSSIYRHVVVGFFGVILLVLGVASRFNINDARTKSSLFLTQLGTVLFISWFVTTGWASFGVHLSKEPVSPFLGNSQWQNMAPLIEAKEPFLCVPVDPLGWVYGRNCGLINTGIMIGQQFRYKPFLENSHDSSFITQAPSALKSKTVISLAVLLRPLDEYDVAATATVTTSSGAVYDFFGKRTLPKTGGLLLFTLPISSTDVQDVQELEIKFNTPVQVAFLDDSKQDTVAILWFGF